MKLPLLRERIRIETGPLKNPLIKRLSRTIHIVLTPWFSDLEKWFGDWFPFHDDEVAQVYPWIHWTETEDNQTTLQKALTTAFDLNTTAGLAEKGYSVLDTINQVIFLVDLSEPGAVGKLEKSVEALEAAINSLILDQTIFHRLGVFLLRRSDMGNGKAFASVDTEAFERISNFSRKRLDRLFLFDSRNDTGTIISGSADLQYLVGHLVYALRHKPIESEAADAVRNYSEWLHGNNVAEGKVTGFAGVSEVVPIDEILETCLVRKGVEVMRAAFLTPVDEKKAEAYANAVLAENHLISNETLAHFIEAHDKYRLFDPFSEAGKGKPSTRETNDGNKPSLSDEVDYLAAFDEKLLQYATDNTQVMAQLAGHLQSEFVYSLRKYLDQILVGEVGGIWIAERFLNCLKEHAQCLIPEHVAEPRYEEPSGLIAHLRDKVGKGPVKESLFVRTLLLVITCAVGAAAIEGMPFRFRLGLLGFALLSIAASFVYWHSWKTRIDRTIIKIWQRIRNKWNTIRAHDVQQTITEKLPAIVAVVNEAHGNIKDATRRVTELLEYFQADYEAKVERKSVLWDPIVLDENRLGRLLATIEADIENVARDYVAYDEPMRYWDRLGKPEAGDPNEWEWGVLEKASVRIIPFAQDVIHTEVCSLLREDEQQFDTIRAKMTKCCRPFLVTKVNASKGTVHGRLEAHTAGCADVVDKLRTVMKRRFDNLSEAESPIYRITLLSFLEDVDLDAVDIGK